MKTTHVFVELLITGFGVVIWLVMAIAGLLGLNLNDILSKVDIVTLAPIAGLAYVFGIIVDRIGYKLFSSKRDKIMKEYIGFTTPYQIIKYIADRSEPLRSRLEYNRSRIRVCRSWIINFSFISVVSFLWMSHSLFSSLMCWELLLIAIMSFLFAVLAYFTLMILLRDYYGEVRDAFEYLTKFSAESIELPPLTEKQIENN